MRFTVAATVLVVCAGVFAGQNELVPARLGEVKLTGWIGEKADRLFERRILSDWAQSVMMKECEDAFVRKTDDSTCVGKWEGEFWGKTMLGFARVAEYTRDPGLMRFIKDSARRLMALQEPDGYIGTYTNKLFVKVKDLDAVKRVLGYECDYNWNIWCRTFTTWALYEVGRVTGEKDISTAAVRSLEQIVDMLHDNGIDITDTGCNAGLPSCTVIRPALAIYEQTKNPKFLDFAREIVAKWDRPDDVPPNFFRYAGTGRSPWRWYQDRLPPKKNYEWPKVNEMVSCLQGLLEYGRLTDDRRSLDTAVRMYDILWREERNPVDSVGYNDKFHCASRIPVGMTEPCDIVVWMMFCHDLYLLTGDARYADTLEAAYLNAFLAGITRDGSWGMRGVRSHGRHTAATPGSGTMKHSQCCVNNLPRGFMDFAEVTLARDREGAYRLAFFTDARAAMDGLGVEVSGNWPVGDVAEVKVVSDRAARLKFRVPQWSGRVSVNGAEAAVRDGWTEVSVPAGESVYRLGFDMEARVLPPVQPCDPANFSLPEITGVRWLLGRGNGDLTPYFIWDDLMRVRRGPILLAKAKSAGASERDIFDWRRISHESHRCVLKPLTGVDAWGAWEASFELTGKPTQTSAFKVRLTDYQSAADRIEQSPVKSFSIFF